MEFIPLMYIHTRNKFQATSPLPPQHVSNRQNIPFLDFGAYCSTSPLLVGIAAVLRHHQQQLPRQTQCLWMIPTGTNRDVCKTALCLFCYLFFSSQLPTQQAIPTISHHLFHGCHHWRVGKLDTILLLAQPLFFRHGEYRISKARSLPLSCCCPFWKMPLSMGQRKM